MSIFFYNMDKKYKQNPKKGKYKQDPNKTRKDKKDILGKKIKRENTKKEEEEEEEEENKKLLEKIKKVKYIIVITSDDGVEKGIEIFQENGEKIDLHGPNNPLYNGDFGFKADVDTGKILDWPDTKIYAKVNVRAIDSGFYGYYDKDNNIIYEGHGYVPGFLGISSPAYGDDICFDTDVNGFILDWKEKKTKEGIIKQLRQDLLGEYDDLINF